MLLSVTETGGGSVKLSSALADPRQVATSIQPQMDEAPISTLTLGGCDAGYVTVILWFSGVAKRALIDDSMAREVPSSNAARTYSHPTDASETNECKAVGTKGPAADELGSHPMSVTTPADNDEIPTTVVKTVSVTLAKPTSLTYNCAKPGPTPEATGRAGTD